MKKNKTNKLIIVLTQTKGIRIFHAEQYEKALLLARMTKANLKVVRVWK